MKSGILSLALLGSPARGCFLRPDKEASTPNALPGRMMIERAFPTFVEDVARETEDVAFPALRTPSIKDTTPRERRMLEKSALRMACSKDEYFSECEQGSGSAKTLELCLQKKAARSGVRLTSQCLRGIESW